LVLGFHLIDRRSAKPSHENRAQTGAYPRADGKLAIAFLAYGPCQLLLGPRDELHYENPPRARLVRRGPPGLGTLITLIVPDLDQVYAVVSKAKLEVLLEPVEEFYGDRVFMFLDPDGYEWKISQIVRQVSEREVASIIKAS
jgi:uncharacterized glyoxalase superfamily protein PhnB